MFNKYKRVAVDYAVVLIAWGTTTQLYAQQLSQASRVTFGSDLESIPLKSIIYVGLLAFLGGLSSTLQKFANPDVVIPRISIEIAKDLVVSLVAGALAFFLLEQANVPVMIEAASITAAGWAGSSWMDKAASKLLDLEWIKRSKTDKE